MKRILPLFTLGCFLVTSIVGPNPLYAQEALHLPVPGVMVHLSPEFDPPLLKGIKVHPENPFRFDFILDKGDDSNPINDSEAAKQSFKEESAKLIKYFLASLTIPDKDLWVNLSPYEKNRIIPQSFGLTEMGRDLLAEDYMLKQITASLIYPEDRTGKEFWKRIYEEAQKKFGTTNIPVNTFNKVWIVPDKAVVYENAKEGTAYVVESKLKVMLEQDYLALEKNTVAGIQNKNDINANSALPLATRYDISSIGANIVREIVIPELTKEVNEDKNFSQLRQVYNSLILAVWYKQKIKNSILAQVYEDKKKVSGVNIDDPQETQKIYQRYLQAFKKGVYNYIKEDLDPVTQETVPRKYFSGGMNLDFAMSTLRGTPLPLGSGHTTLTGARGRLIVIRPDSNKARKTIWAQIKKAMGYSVLASVVLSAAGVTYVVKEYGGNHILELAHRIKYPSNSKSTELVTDFHFKPITEKDGIRYFENDADIFQEIIPIVKTRLKEQEAKVKVNKGKAFKEDLSILKMIDECVRNKQSLQNSDIGLLRVAAEHLQTVPYEEKAELIRAIKNLSGAYMHGRYDPKKQTAFIVSGFMAGGLSSQEPYVAKMEQSVNFVFLLFDTRELFGDSMNLVKNTLESPVFRDKQYVLIGVSTGAFIIRGVILNNLNNPKMDFHKVTLLELAAPYGGAPLAGFVIHHPHIPILHVLGLESAGLENILAIQDPDGPIAPWLFSPLNEEAIHTMFKARLYIFVGKDEYGPNGFSAKEKKKKHEEALKSGFLFPLSEKISDDHAAMLDSHMPPIETMEEILRKFPNVQPNSIKSFFNDKEEEVLKQRQAVEKQQHAVAMKKYGVSAGAGLMGIQRRQFDNIVKTRLAQNNRKPVTVKSGLPGDMAQIANKNGGIDLNTANINLQVQHQGGEIKFKIDPAMLKKLQNAPGFVPVIINIQPVTDLRTFLGLNEQKTLPLAG